MFGLRPATVPDQVICGYCHSKFDNGAGLKRHSGKKHKGKKVKVLKSKKVKSQAKSHPVIPRKPVKRIVGKRKPKPSIVTFPKFDKLLIHSTA